MSALARLAPDAERALRGLEGALWVEPRLRELVEIRTAQLDGASASLLRHAREALALGESHERLAALAGWRDSPLFDACERAALELAEAVARRDAAAAAAARRAAAAHLDAHALAQLAFACAAAGAADVLELALGEGAP